MRSFLTLFLCLFSFFGVNLRSFGAPVCSICLTDTEQESEIIQCSQGHALHPGCLNHQIEGMDDIREIRTMGLRCHGSEDTCDQRFLLDEIMRSLEAAQGEALERRLSQAFEITDNSLAEFEFRRLSQGIEEAFNLSCPACGGILAEIEGCNAATCQVSTCKTTFCYLCLKEQGSSQAAHAHVRGQHSGDFWDYRPGYPGRYHWLLARKELASLFRKKVEPEIRDSVLQESKQLLDDRNMWPFPCGKRTADWIQEVQSDCHLTREKKIELLQNEGIYQRQMKNKKNAALVSAEIRNLGGIVLASLDIRDAAGVNSQRVPRAVPEIAAVGNHDHAHGPANRVGGQIIPVMADDVRVTPEFAALGNMYQVGNLIWSGVAPGKMKYHEAKRFCEKLDGIDRGWFRKRKGNAKLPGREAFLALRTAMGYPNHYNPNLMPDMRGNSFWVLDNWSGLIYGFRGNDGTFNRWAAYFTDLVRCVLDA